MENIIWNQQNKKEKTYLRRIPENVREKKKKT